MYVDKPTSQRKEIEGVEPSLLGSKPKVIPLDHTSKLAYTHTFFLFKSSSYIDLYEKELKAFRRGLYKILYCLQVYTLIALQ